MVRKEIEKQIIDAIYKGLPKNYRNLSEIYCSGNFTGIMSRQDFEMEQDIFFRLYDGNSISVMVYNNGIMKNSEMDEAIIKGIESLGYTIHRVLKLTTATEYYLKKIEDAIK